MTFLLDTNAVIKILANDPRVVQHAARYATTEIVMSSIVMYELFFGAFKGMHTVRTLSYIDALKFDTLDFNSDNSRMAGELRAVLNAAGTPIGPYDLLIAGQAMARGLIVVTHNVREFSRVKNLRVEDWEM